MVQRILQLKQENVNLFGWEIRDILKAEQAQAKSAIKSGSNYCLKSKHLVMTSIPSVSSINRILRSSDGRPEPGEKQQLVSSSNGFPSSSSTAAAAPLHSAGLLNPLAAGHHAASLQNGSLQNNSLQNGSLQNGSLQNSSALQQNNAPSLQSASPYSNQTNGRAKNLMNLNALNLLNSIKAQEQQSKLRADHKDAYLASIHHQLYHPMHPNSLMSGGGTPLGNSLQSLHNSSLNSASLNNASLNSASLNNASLNSSSLSSTPLNGSLSNPNSHHPSPASVQNLLQLSSSQLLINQPPVEQPLDQLTANQAFQLATSYLNAKASNLMQHASQANHHTNLDHAAFILSQMHWQQLLSQSGGSMNGGSNLVNSAVNSAMNSAVNSAVNSVTGDGVNGNPVNNKPPINSTVNSLINSPKHLHHVQEPLTLSSLMGNLNAVPSGLPANPQLSSAMNNLLLTTKPNVFSQLLQQTAMLPDGQTFGSLSAGQSTGEHSPDRQTKKCSSFNIADILMNEYNKQEIGPEIGREIRREIGQEIRLDKQSNNRQSDHRSDGRPEAKQARSAFKPDIKQETGLDQIRAINERMLGDQLKDERVSSVVREKVKCEKDEDLTGDEKDDERDDVRVDILD